LEKLQNLICATVEEVYINKLKDGTTFFHKIFACSDLLEHLEKNSTGLQPCINNVSSYLKHNWHSPHQLIAKNG
jgi:hypothetical protein